MNQDNLRSPRIGLSQEGETAPCLLIDRINFNSFPLRNAKFPHPPYHKSHVEKKMLLEGAFRSNAPLAQSATAMSWKAGLFFFSFAKFIFPHSVLTCALIQPPPFASGQFCSTIWHRHFPDCVNSLTLDMICLPTGAGSVNVPT